MDEREQASFEPRAVLARRRAGWNRLAILLPTDGVNLLLGC